MTGSIRDFIDSIVAEENARAAGNAGGNTGGGGETVTGSAASSTLDEFQPDGGTLALAYGPHVVRGHLLRTDYNAGPPPLHKLIIGLGEGGGIGWEGPEKVLWAGEELSLSPDGTTPGYHFHPGTYSTGTGDPVQGEDSFFISPLTYSGTAYVALRLTEVQSAESATDKHVGVYKGLKTYDYDANGVQSASATYSTNPARIIADGFRRAGLLDRIHWPSWYALKTHCDETISWDDGNSVRSIARFLACPVWTSEVALPEFVEAVCLVCGATPQDDGERVRFKLVTDQVPVHHFDNDDTSGFAMEPDSVRDRINVFKVSARDLDDEYLRNTTLTIERPELIERYGKREQSVSLPNMTQSQLRRVGEMLMRLSTDNPNRASFQAGEEAFHVLPGDYVTISKAVNGWFYQLCRVESITDQSTSSTPGVRQFTVRRIDGPIYSDSDHAKRQLPE